MTSEIFFGFKKIGSDKKQHLVNQVFSSVSSKYDIMNDLMSFGIHRLWKKRFIAEITNPQGRLLDVASGTGDIALRFYQKAQRMGFIPSITMVDINLEMLIVGRSKFIDKGIIKGIDWICSNGENLSFTDNNFDYYSCAFGIRNMTNINQALIEAYRILKPGGKFVCMEFSPIKDSKLARLYEFYSMNFIPLIGKKIANDEKAYKYLVESIQKFPSPVTFSRMLENAGFNNIKFKELSEGISIIYTANK